ncbi:MAG TPA: hypothetical protein VKQ36_10100 [Ktedonobacterales bacterium]|nr:hypothetical protein [Ktedonobacterales bacterium]
MQDHQETSTPVSEARQQGWRRLRSPLGVIATATLVLALVAALAFLLTSRTGNGVALAPQPSPTAPPHWRLYHAPNDAFSVAIPSAWAATVQTSQATTSYHGESDTFTTTLIALSGKDTITVDITLSPIDALEHRWSCQAKGNLRTNTKVAGLPAMYDPVLGWLFDTNAAHFQISYFYPGFTGNILLQSAPTPIPTAEYNQGQREITAIVASFHPNPDEPLKC